MSKLRFRVVEKAFHKKPVEVASPATRPSEYFAKYVFNREKMFKYLPSNVYAKLIDVIDNGATLDKKWAIALWVYQFTPRVQPLSSCKAAKA